MNKITVIAMALAAMIVAACEPETPPPSASAGAGSGTISTAPVGPPADSPEYFRQVVGDRVFFATDQFALDDVARLTLDKQAQWLIQNPGVTVSVEGHADERGTRQYNLALGARRSNAVQRYLAQQGVAPDRIRSVTFGKERPVALCSEERCWSQNRRGVTVLTGGPVS